MIRVTDGILVIAAIAGAVWTYQIKHEAELSARKLSDLRSKIAAQENKITLLEADWAIMTSPSRLEKLAEKFKEDLQLAPLQSTQIVTLDELPDVRPAPDIEQIQVDADPSTPDVAEANEIDETVTGSVSASEPVAAPLPDKLTVPTFRRGRPTQ